MTTQLSTSEFDQTWAATATELDRIVEAATHATEALGTTPQFGGAVIAQYLNMLTRNELVNLCTVAIARHVFPAPALPPDPLTTEPSP